MNGVSARKHTGTLSHVLPGGAHADSAALSDHRAVELGGLKLRDPENYPDGPLKKQAEQSVRPCPPVAHLGD